MTDSISTISSARLDLVAMTPAFLEASLAGDSAAASRLLGLAVPPPWFEARDLIQLRLEQLRADPSLQPWLLRAIVQRDTGAMVGHIGFHAAPGAPYLAELAPGGAELGYSVFESFRRQGIATEACAALMDWAAARGVRRFVLSISPNNQPSQRIATHFGFRKVGAHVDDEDGPEDIFVRELDPPA